MLIMIRMIKITKILRINKKMVTIKTVIIEKIKTMIKKKYDDNNENSRGGLFLVSGETMVVYVV